MKDAKKKREITLFTTLEGVKKSDFPKLEDIQCKYYVSGVEKVADVTKGYRPFQFRILLRDIETTARIVRLVLEDPSTERRWVMENFAPFEPDHQLKKE